MEKIDLTPEESFDVIKKAIANFKINYRESSKVFLLWGWMLTLASVSNFIILRFVHSLEPWALKGYVILGSWALFILTGFIIMYFMVRKMNRDKKVHSHIDQFIDYLWWVTASSFVIATFICIRLGIAPPSLMLLVAGIATTTTGLVIKFRPLIIGGMSFFVFSVAASFVMNEYLALVVSAVLICGFSDSRILIESSKRIRSCTTI
ncbi:MAG: hypothetical protein WAW07_07805 [Bacteroidales bacterium]